MQPPREWRRGWNIPILPCSPPKTIMNMPTNGCLVLCRHVKMRQNLKKSFIKWKSLYKWWKYFFLAHESYTYFLPQVLLLFSILNFDCSKVCVATQEQQWHVYIVTSWTEIEGGCLDSGLGRLHVPTLRL